MLRSALAAAISAIILSCGGFAANATLLVFTADLDGPSEAPPNASPGTGVTEIERSGPSDG